MYPYETLDDIPDEVWDIIDSFFEKDDTDITTNNNEK